jgi:glycosyltransferase involved in cell wall biosynthesis
MKVLILTQYFPPETGAPQNRLYELALRLKQEGIEIEVLTAMPNYPQMEIHPNYRGKSYVFEYIGGIATHRSRIFVSKSKAIPARLLNYFSFVCSSFFTGWRKIKKTDLIFCESPPLFLGISAWALCKLKKANLIFNVSDLWPESAEKLGLVTNRFFLRSATKLEEFLYRNSLMITGQTQGIVKNISERFPKKNVQWLPNGVDLNYFSPISKKNEWRNLHDYREDDFILLYAGILGHAQGLEVILNAATLLQDAPQIHFLFLGAGPEKEKLEKLCESLQLSSVTFMPAVAKDKMPEIISSVNAAIIPLKRIDLFKGAIPSKIFETLAMEKPILLGVEGEAKDLFINQGKCGLAFIPENASSLASAIRQLYNDPDLVKNLGTNGRIYVEKNFNRNLIALRFKQTLEEAYKARMIK